MGLFSKIKEGLKKTRDAVMGQIDSMLKSFTKIDEELFEELEELLVMGDVGVPTAEKICDELRVKVRNEGITDPAEISGLLEDIITEMLSGGEELDISTSPSIILVIGVNGVGKTTTIGKLAKQLSDQGKKVLLAAADTFRAAAIDQLDIWAQRSGCEIIKQGEGSDPAAVIFDAIAAAKQAEREAAAEEREREREKTKKKRTFNTIGGAAAGTVGREVGNTLGSAVGGKLGKKVGGNVGASLGRGILKTLLGL